MTVLTIALAVMLVAALCGWSWFLVRFSLVRLEDAKALEIMDRVGAKIDNRVHELFAIAEKRLREKYGPAVEADMERRDGTTGRILDDEGEAMREMRRKSQGVSGLRIFDETEQTPEEPSVDLGAMPVGVEG